MIKNVIKISLLKENGINKWLTEKPPEERYYKTISLILFIYGNGLKNYNFHLRDM